MTPEMSFFSALGAAVVTMKVPNLKLILLDGPLASRVKELVVSANRQAVTTGVISSSNFQPEVLSPYAIAVLPDPERVGLTAQGSGLFCDTSRDFWAVKINDQNALVNLRLGDRLVVSSSELEEASLGVYQVWMNSDKSLSAEFSRLFVDMFAEDLFDSQVGAQVEVDFRDRLTAAVTLVAAVYSAMARAPRIGRGSLFLLHLESAFRNLRAVASGLDARNDKFALLTDAVFPSFSLPNPQSGSEFGVDSPVQEAVIRTISKNWGSSVTTAQSLALVKLMRNLRNHPHATPPMYLESWLWTGFDRMRDDEGHENAFLGWQLINGSDSKRHEAFQSRFATEGLTEQEFFEPYFDATPIDGEWSDGSPLTERHISGEVMLVQPLRFAPAETEFVSDEVSLFVPVIPGINLAPPRLSEIVVTFIENSNLKFDATSHHIDVQREILIIRGVFRGVLSPGSEGLEFVPRVWVASIKCPHDLTQYVLPTQGRKVIMLPLSGTGFLVAEGLTYQGPELFDASAAPLDQKSEYEYEIDNGSSLRVIAWSGIAPSNIKVEDPQSRDVAPDLSRRSIRLVETLTANGEPMRVIQESV